MKTNRRIVLCVIFLIAAAAVVTIGRRHVRSPSAVVSPSPARHDTLDPQLAAAVVSLEQREHRLRETLWAPEIRAEECNRAVDSLWDSLNQSADKLSTESLFEVGKVILGNWSQKSNLSHNIVEQRSAGAAESLTSAAWKEFVQERAREGWVLEECEFAHESFLEADAGNPCQSIYRLGAYLSNPRIQQRVILEGELIVRWGKLRADGLRAMESVDASHLKIKSRAGALPFELILQTEIRPLENSHRIDPLILYDLDHDGSSEVLLAARNVLFRRNGAHYVPGPLFTHPPGSVSTAVIADFTNDGNPDLLCENAKGLLLFEGNSAGKFDGPGRVVFTSRQLVNPMVMTCGDIDNDGALDAFLGQYREPYDGGATPFPFHDATNGFPAFLLANDGHGTFRDATQQAGLGAKRNRRMFSSSLADVDRDGALDLVCVSDFAGLDLFKNNGHGRFNDISVAAIDEKHGFGMAHAFSDFNRDGLLDLLMIGMTSPAADRLESLGLWRNEQEDRTMRRLMVQGNRLYLANSEGHYTQNAFGSTLARSGWSWGCSAFDFDNDGYPDVYIANGMESNSSVRDYDPECWLHDKYAGGAADDSVAYYYLKSKVARLRGRDYSLGGYQENRFFLNLAGRSFTEVAYLMGVALQADCRNVVSDDLDGDGRVDLLVTSLELWPKPRQVLRIYRNRVDQPGNWIGFRFREQPGTISPVGVSVTIYRGGDRATAQSVTGDSFRSQHAPVLHFGIGSHTTVDRAEITWPGGRSLVLKEPQVNQYHAIRSPARAGESSPVKNQRP